jgi:hypothetical protein
MASKAIGNAPPPAPLPQPAPPPAGAIGAAPAAISSAQAAIAAAGGAAAGPAGALIAALGAPLANPVTAAPAEKPLIDFTADEKQLLEKMYAAWELSPRFYLCDFLFFDIYMGLEIELKGKPNKKEHLHFFAHLFMLRYRKQMALLGSTFLEVVSERPIKVNSPEMTPIEEVALLNRADLPKGNKTQLKINLLAKILHHPQSVAILGMHLEDLKKMGIALHSIKSPKKSLNSLIEYLKFLDFVCAEFYTKEHPAYEYGGVFAQIKKKVGLFLSHPQDWAFAQALKKAIMAAIVEFEKAQTALLECTIELPDGTIVKPKELGSEEVKKQAIVLQLIKEKNRYLALSFMNDRVGQVLDFLDGHLLEQLFPNYRSDKHAIGSIIFWAQEVEGLEEKSPVKVDHLAPETARILLHMEAVRKEEGKSKELSTLPVAAKAAELAQVSDPAAHDPMQDSAAFALESPVEAVGAVELAQAQDPFELLARTLSQCTWKMSVETMASPSVALFHEMCVLLSKVTIQGQEMVRLNKILVHFDLCRPLIDEMNRSLLPQFERELEDFLELAREKFKVIHCDVLVKGGAQIIEKMQLDHARTCQPFTIFIHVLREIEALLEAYSPDSVEGKRHWFPPALVNFLLLDGIEEVLAEVIAEKSPAPKPAIAEGAAAAAATAPLPQGKKKQVLPSKITHDIKLGKLMKLLEKAGLRVERQGPHTIYAGPEGIVPVPHGSGGESVKKRTANAILGQAKAALGKKKN